MTLKLTWLPSGSPLLTPSSTPGSTSSSGGLCFDACSVYRGEAAALAAIPPPHHRDICFILISPRTATCSPSSCAAPTSSLSSLLLSNSPRATERASTRLKALRTKDMSDECLPLDAAAQTLLQIRVATCDMESQQPVCGPLLARAAGGAFIQ